MAMAPRIARHLAAEGIEHRVIDHMPTPTASEAAQATHISGNQIAKAVVLRDSGGFLLAVLPASHHVSLELVRATLGRPAALADEDEASALFPDCDQGAIPPLGQLYDLDVMVDESLADLETVSFEGGDHQSLVQVSGDAFKSLTINARRGRFSVHD